MRIDVKNGQRTVSFSRVEVRELRNGATLLSFVAESMPGAISSDVASGVVEFVKRIADDGTYQEPSGE